MTTSSLVDDKVTILGNGVAAMTAAFCFVRNGFSARITRPFQTSRSVPVTLNSRTWSLLLDLFGKQFAVELAPKQISKRLVDWSDQTPATVIQQPAYLTTTARSRWMGCVICVG